MPTQKTLREILEHIWHKGFITDSEIIRITEIDNAISEIKSLIKGKLPRPIKPEIRIAKPLCEISFNKGRIVGHNSAITEIEKILEALCQI